MKAKQRKMSDYLGKSDNNNKLNTIMYITHYIKVYCRKEVLRAYRLVYLPTLHSTAQKVSSNVL